MSKEFVSRIISGLLERKAERKQEETIRQKFTQESRVIAVNILSEYGTYSAKKTPDVPIDINNCEVPKATISLKTPPVPIGLGEKKGSIRLEQPLISPDKDGPNKNIFINFQEDGQIPSERPEEYFLYVLEEWSISSIERDLKTPHQFAELNSVLGFIKTSLESSAVSTEPSLLKK